MTLKEWAEREGLTYLTPNEELASEYMIKEVVYRYRGHCLDCADWYAYRDSHGTLRRFTEVGSSASAIIISEDDLDVLKASDCDG